MRLDRPPPHRKIVIAFWQAPDAMKMIRHHDNAIHDERIVGTRATESFAKIGDPFDEQIVSTALREIDGEEIASALDARAGVGPHEEIRG